MHKPDGQRFGVALSDLCMDNYSLVPHESCPYTNLGLETFNI
ncbi:hypothetical protein A152_0019055 [Vibrio tasmaniensis 1F-187]|nr:hypothetical protein [Vibrio tasmaniensis]